MNNRDKHVNSSSGSGSKGNRRTYDCEICMKGFTNPQALGGHNNLHRRERESKLSSSSASRSFPFPFPLPQNPSSSLNFTNPNHTNNSAPSFPTIDSYSYDPQGFQLPSNPSYNAQYFGSSSPGGGGGNYGHSEFLGLDLSLGPGPMNVDDNTNRTPPETGGSQPRDDDLDLDLRLGRRHHH